MGRTNRLKFCRTHLQICRLRGGPQLLGQLVCAKSRFGGLSSNPPCDTTKLRKRSFSILSHTRACGPPSGSLRKVQKHNFAHFLAELPCNTQTVCHSWGTKAHFLAACWAFGVDEHAQGAWKGRAWCGWLGVPEPSFGTGILKVLARIQFVKLYRKVQSHFKFRLELGPQQKYIFAWLVENKQTPKKPKKKRGANSGEDAEMMTVLR